jgi:ubiquinone/menaquinone biosynthesis C-methylase UbiE
MLPRILEPEVMDTPQEAVDYDAMDHSTVNRAFVDDFLAFAGTLPSQMRILDAGTGTAQIPIELCSRFRSQNPFPLQVEAIDLAAEMLKVAERNVAAAGFGDAITLRCVDCKSLPDADGSFDAVISNSIVHHIPRPRDVLAEMWRVLKPGGAFFIRDLLRPPDAATLDQLVITYAGRENAHQQKMFRESLHAALTLDELRGLLADVGIPSSTARQTTDRHWTLSTLKEIIESGTAAE